MPSKSPLYFHSQKFSPVAHISGKQYSLPEHDLQKLNIKTETIKISQLFQKIIHRIAVMCELGIHVEKDLHKALTRIQ